MHKGILVVFILSFSLVKAQQITLSPQALISVITCGPGQEELYTAFGHSAIRVFDPVNNIDNAYNYGVFDFDQPNFYLNYTRGLLLFKLGVYTYPDFVDIYRYYNRWVTEQELNLSASQKQAVFDFLEWNALPENQTYRYDYFYNNCANKVRDVFATVLGDSIRFDDAHITTTYTIRQLTDLYLKDQPWGDLGIDICLGLPMDKRASPYEYMFLPDYVLKAFDNATITHGGSPEALVSHKYNVSMSFEEDPPHAAVHPWVALGSFALLAVGLSLWDFRRKKASAWFDVVLFTVVGLVGALLLVLWTATDHQAASNNLNIIWALPTHLMILGVFLSRARRIVKRYFLFAGLLMALLLMTWAFLPQQLNTFLIPFVAVLVIRAMVLSRFLTESVPLSRLKDG